MCRGSPLDSRRGSDGTATQPETVPDAPAGGRGRLLLLDGHSLAYRAFFALPTENFSTTTGQTTNAVYGFTSMLINLLRDEEPTHVAVAFDVSRQTFRAETFAAYKANRSARRPTSSAARSTSSRTSCAVLAIPVLAVEGYEADDVIATLTTQAVAEGMSVSICTGDRDAFQLVSPDVTVLYPRKGVSDLVRYTPEQVMERYTLTPEQYPDFAALRGDPSDNLPSIPGVGEKTAQKWVREFGSLDALVDRVDEVRGKAGDALRENLSSVVLNRQLTELVRDVEGIGAGPHDLEVRQWDRDAVHQLFDQLEFRVLRERLFSTLTAAAPGGRRGLRGPWRRASSPARWPTGSTTTPATARASASPSAARGPTARATSRASRSPRPTARARTSTSARSTRTTRRRSPAGSPTPRCRRRATRSRGRATRCGRAAGALEGVTSDTALAAYLARPGERSFDLADLALRYLRRELRVEETGDAGDQLTLDGGEEEADTALAQAEMLRARAVTDLAEKLDDGPRRARGHRAAHRARAAAARRCWPTSRPPASRSTSARCTTSSRSSGRACRPRRSPRTTSSARRSTSGRRSSSRWCCSTSSRCRRPSAPRRATPPTRTRCRR